MSQLQSIKKKKLKKNSNLLTFMLLVGRIMYSDWDQDKEDEKGPDDFNKQLDLQREETQTRDHTS